MTEQDHVCADECGHERTGGYVYTGEPAASRSMDLTVRYADDIRTVPAIDDDGLWVTVMDGEGMECEVRIAGLTYRLMDRVMIDTERRGLAPSMPDSRMPDAADVLSSMLATYMSTPRALRPGAELMIMVAIQATLGLTGAAADEWLARTLQEMYADQG